MRRLIFLLGTSLLLVACEKDYNCTCNIKTTSSSGTIFSTERFHLDAHNRNDANAACNAYKYQAQAPGATATYTCSLD